MNNLPPPNLAEIRQIMKDIGSSACDSVIVLQLIHLVGMLVDSIDDLNQEVRSLRALETDVKGLMEESMK